MLNTPLNTPATGPTHPDSNGAYVLFIQGADYAAFQRQAGGAFPLEMGREQPECWAIVKHFSSRVELRRVNYVYDIYENGREYSDRVRAIDPNAQITLAKIIDKDRDILGPTEESGMAGFLTEAEAITLFHKRDYEQNGLHGNWNRPAPRPERILP